MPAGEPFTTGQRLEIERAITLADRQSPLSFRVYVGQLEHGRTSAEALHSALPYSDQTVLIAVDPAVRAVEIVTSPQGAEWLDDRACGLGALAMTSGFAAGDLVGGMRAGLQVLAEHARHPRSLHSD